MYRTPPPSTSGKPDPTDKVSTPPYAKLAAVTRKENEITLLLEALDSSDLGEVKDEFTIYLKRVEALYEAAAETHSEWLEQHTQKISEFRLKIESLVHPVLSEPHSQRNSENTTVSGKSSSSSRASSARIRLAEQRAKLVARKQSDNEYAKLKKEELAMKAEHEKELLAIELKKEQIKTQRLEKEMNELARELESIEGRCNASISSHNVGDNNKDINGNEDAAIAATSNIPHDRPPNMHVDNMMEKQNQIAQAMTECQRQSFLPKRELQIFDGSDVTMYKNFIVNFDRIIVRSCDSDGDKFLYLQQYTRGKAKKLVDGCVHYDAYAGYLKARAALDKEYGDEFRISNSYLEKISNWPNIPQEDSEKLNDFAILLFDCNNYLENMSISNQLQNPKVILSIVSKLPYRMRDRWRRITHKLLTKKEPVIFSNLVTFVQEEAAILKQPLYGKISDTKVPNIVKKKPSGKLAAVTQSDHSDRCFCPYCKKTNHLLNDCTFFSNISYKDKSAFVKKQNLCFGCFKTDHMSRNCTERLTCDICKKKHPTVLHNYEYSRSITKPLYTEPTEPATDTRSCHRVSSMKKIVCPVVPAKISVKGRQEKILVNCALDTCSTDCWVNESLLDKLGLFPQSTNMKVSTMSEKNMSMKTRVVNNLQIFDIDETFCTTVPVVFTKPPDSWPFSKDDIVTPQEVHQFQHLSELPFSFLEEEVGILIGMSASELLKPLEVMDGEPDEPYACLYKLGWCVSGSVRRDNKKISICNRTLIDRDAMFDLEQYYNRDFVEHSIEKCMSHDDKKWLHLVQSSVLKLPNGHFQIDLPLKTNATFPDNKAQVYKNFMHLKRRLDSNNNFKAEYTKFMNNMLMNKYAEKINRTEVPGSGTKFYIAHHGVYHKTKKKLRVVFNCSMKYKGVSLNDNLEAGPDLTNNLLGVLLRFRQEKFAFTADIRQMFYQVFVSEHHSDLMRFFWMDEAGKVEEYRICVHVFGSKASPSICNFALRSSVNEADCSLETRSTILRNFYVDDCLKSTPSEEDCIETFNETSRVLAGSGFQLASVQSNSPYFLKQVNTDVVSTETEISDDTMALGIIWNKDKDTLRFRANLAQHDTENITKRIILKVLASVYDPIGIISPVLTPAKKLFQDACASNSGWDDPLPPHMICSWKKWLSNMKNLQAYDIPRCIRKTKTICTVELHVYSDGGETGYGSVAFAKFNYEDKTYSSSILASKGRLTPINNRTLKTIPRIELTAAKLAIELSLKLQDELDYHFHTINYWSDSTTVLQYIKGTHHKFHRFVENKVNFIRNFSTPEQWFYVPSLQNPADIVSRGSTPQLLASSELWNYGPDYLRGLANLPEQNFKSSVQAEDSEVKTRMATSNEVTDPVDVLMESTSHWQKLRVRIASLLNFRQSLREAIPFTGKNLTVDDLKNAEVNIYKYLQDKYFCETISKVNMCQNLPRSCNIRKLNPFVDNLGLLRVGGRLAKSIYSFNVKHPIILPSCHVSKLIIQNLHCSLGHLGREVILAKLRTNYWIIKANTLVRKVCRDCLVCRRVLGKPSEALMADLPRDRLDGDVPPFTDVAIDYFGPYIVTCGRKTEKRYGVIFSCLASRAIHIELAHSMTTSSFIQALRRFASRRGNVKSLRSDNGTNFTGANKELKNSINDWNENSINNWCLQADIKWSFNPVYGSHFGGIHERQIRSIRKTLNSILLEQTLRLYDEDLHTLMCEVEAVLNNRPISEVSSDPDDLEALTPNHLLLLNAGITFPPGLFSKEDSYVKRRWRQTQYLAELFWSRWKKEYLVLLQQRQKWFLKTSPHQTGDLVLIVDKNTPRNQWSLGRIVETTADTNGNVRSAKIKICQCKDSSLTKFKTSIIERPIVKLIMLRSVSTL